MSGRTDIPISEETRERVLRAARELGYSPSPAASALRTGKTGIVGFWMSLAYSRYRSQVADHMRIALEPSGMVMATIDANADYAQYKTFSRALRLPVDGIIAFDAWGSVEEFTCEADRLGLKTPFVSMGAYWSERKSYVAVDLKAGAELAVEHLIERGRRRIAYIAPGDSGLLTSGARHDGYISKMREVGLPPILIPTDTVSVAAVERALVAYLREYPAPDALICVSDEFAVEALAALDRIGLKPGKEVALIGYNGIEGIDRLSVPLSTVAQPIEEMCRLAVHFLRAQMEDPKEIHQTILKPTLIARASTE